MYTFTSLLRHPGVYSQVHDKGPQMEQLGYKENKSLESLLQLCVCGMGGGICTWRLDDNLRHLIYLVFRGKFSHWPESQQLD